MIASMSRKGDRWDNAVAESFFATLRAELVDAERYSSPEAAETCIGDYVESFQRRAAALAEHASAPLAGCSRDDGGGSSVRVLDVASLGAGW